MKTTLVSTLIILFTSAFTALHAQVPCPETNKMKDGSCLMIDYATPEAASIAVTPPAEILVISGSTDEVSDGVYIAQYACNSNSVIYTKSQPCNCTGYEGTIKGTFKFMNAELTCTYDAAGVLPVEFSYFKAEIDNKMALLTWGTSNEVENEGFYVEKSTDGKFFQEFAFVVGEGNSNEEIDYETMDRDPSNGVNYYRLKQVDYNGKERFSDVVELDFRKDNGISLDFNDSRQEVTLRTQNKLQSIEIFDMAGVRVLKSTLNENDDQHSIAFVGQKIGHYVAVITDKNGAVQTIKFAKL